MTITLNGDSGITAPTYGGTVASEYHVPVTAFKNRIINGAMQIDQRNAGASVTPTGGTYTLDRWALAITQSSKLSIQQSTTTATGFKNSLLATVASAVASPSATDQFLLRQQIEGFNVSDLGWGTANAQTVTISFWVRSSVTGTFPVALLNGSYNRSYVSTYTINSANTFEYKTITVTGDTSGTWATDNSVGINVSFALGTGSNRTTSSANTWQGAEYISTSSSTNLLATNGATFYITGVQLEKGSTATSFDYRPYGTELQLCQRYYETGMIIDYQNGNNSAAASTNIPVVFVVTKRAAPSVTFSSTTLTNISSIQSQNISTNGFGFRMNGGAGTVVVLTTVTASIEL